MGVVVPELSGKNLQWLKEVLPRLARVGVLWNPTNPVSKLELKEMEVAARSLGLQLQLLEVREPTEFERAFAAMARERAGAVTVLVDAMFFSQRRRIVDLAARGRLPAIYQRREFAEDGGLMAYGPSLDDLFRRAATVVEKILKGAKPADLPVEQPTKYELVINRRTAKALGIAMPPSILIRADHVIE
jgi:putative ABC transport system substrate-binding protein